MNYSRCILVDINESELKFYELIFFVFLETGSLHVAFSVLGLCRPGWPQTAAAS